VIEDGKFDAAGFTSSLTRVSVSALIVEDYRQLWLMSTARTLIEVGERRFDQTFADCNQLDRPTTKSGRVCKFVLQHTNLGDFRGLIWDVFDETAEGLDTDGYRDFRRRCDGLRNMEGWFTEFLGTSHGRRKLERLCVRMMMIDVVVADSTLSSDYDDCDCSDCVDGASTTVDEEEEEEEEEEAVVADDCDVDKLKVILID
jgi:hypothetical protein